MWPAVAKGERYSLERFTDQLVAGLAHPPLHVGEENIPQHPRFVVCANHYQREDLWIAHPAAAITKLLGARFPQPSVRWVVTANWPRWRLGPWEVPNPGDWLLPRVAFALWSYPVSFAGTNPGFTARSLRQLLRDAPQLRQPIGLFPEGVAGTAGRIGEALPGVGRLLQLLARQGMSVLPVHISERQGLVFRYGVELRAEQVAGVADAGSFVMNQIRELGSTTD